jgi:outer membrane protein assembly factor BamE (lipoprotein component of BamABCDE complex)
MLIKFREAKIALIFVLSFFCVCAPGAAAQVNKNSKTDLPVWQGYKGVVLGMTTAEVRQKLGAPKSEDSADFFYIFSETETADIIFTGQKVTTISISYTEEHKDPPKFEDVFSRNVKADPKPDGAIFKKIDYPEAGYWISYNRMAGEKAMVMIVITSMKKL